MRKARPGRALVAVAPARGPSGASAAWLGKRALEVAYPPFPAGTGAAEDNQARATAGGARVERLGAASPSQARAARGRSPVSREGAAPEPCLGVALGRAPLCGRSPFFQRERDARRGHSDASLLQSNERLLATGKNLVARTRSAANRSTHPHHTTSRLLRSASSRRTWWYGAGLGFRLYHTGP